VGCGDDNKGFDTCTTKADCAGKDPKSTDLICSNLDRVCVTKCSSNADCSTGRTCNTDSGQCEQGGGVPKCSSNADCGTGRTCNTDSGQCEQGGGGNTDGTCTGEGRSTCSYGQFCSNSKCTPAPVAPANCKGFAYNRPSWDPVSSTGPVIYQISRISYEVGYRYCHTDTGMPDAFIVSVRAYRADADWPVLAGWPWFFLNYGGNEHINLFHRLLYGGLVPQSYKRTPANFKDAEFQFYLCSSTRDSSDSQAGFFFANGNPVCLDLTR
jgi:hypothetical protein